MAGRELSSYPITFANTGIVLKGSPDEIPLTSYASLSNVITDQENALTVRRGYSSLGITTGVPSLLFYFQGASLNYRFIKVGTVLYAAQTGGSFSSLQTGMASTPGYFAVNNLGTVPYAFVADGTKFVKSTGTTASNVGLSAPSTALTAAIKELTVDDYTVIDACDNSGSWSASTVSGAGSAAVTSTTGLGGYPYSDAIKLTAGASTDETVVQITQSKSLNLGDEDDEVIQLYLRYPTDADAEAISRVILSFSLGDTTFTTRYEKTLLAHPVQQTTLLSSRETDVVTSQEDYLESGKLRIPLMRIDDVYDQTPPEDVIQEQTVQIAPADIPLGTGAWNWLRIPKNEFLRVGTSAYTDPSLTWADVASIKIELVASSAGASIEIDQITYRSAGVLVGTNYQYLFTYYDSATDTESDYGAIVDAPYPGANHDAMLITFGDAPPTAATHRRLYRIGGTVQDFQRVASIAVATTTYTDNIADADLGDIFDADLQALPAVPKGVAAHDNRLFVWGCSTDSPNTLRFSRRDHVQSFPTEQWIPVGSSGETILRCMADEGELFVFTNMQIYRVIGGGGDVDDWKTYRAVPTGVTHKIAGQHAIVRGDKSVYIGTADGVYEFPSGRKISEAVNPLWHARTINGIAPILSTYLSNMALGYYDNKLYVSYTSSGTTNNATLVYDILYERWTIYSYGVAIFCTEPTLLSASVVGSSNVMQLETGTQDTSGVPIAFTVLTKQLDLGKPDQEKQFVDLVVDAYTAGQTLTVKASIDGAALATVGTLSNSDRGQVVLPFPDSSGASSNAKRLQFQVSGASTTSDNVDAQPIIYKVIPRFFLEPQRHKTFVTDWSNEGIAGSKIFRELHLEIDTFNAAISVAVEVDGATAQTITGVTANGRTKLYYALTTDIKGSLCRLKFTPTGSNEVKIYHYEIKCFAESDAVALIQTPWEDEGAPSQRKRFRKLIVEVDNLAMGETKTITIDLQVDGSSKTITPSTITATQTGRTEYSFSCDADTVGILWRAVITAASGNYMRFYRAWVEAIPEPFQDYRYESPWDNIGSMGQKRLRDLIIEADTNGYDVTVTAWVDGAALAGTYTLNTNSSAPGYGLRKEVVFSLPVDTVGKIVRITATGTNQFTIYRHVYVPFSEAWEDTIIETPWSDDGAPNVRKRFRKLIVEYENLSTGTITFTVQVDGSTVGTITSAGTSETGRREKVFSFPVDTVGTLWRVTGTVSSGTFRFYRAWPEAIPEPQSATTYEAPWNIWGTISRKRFRTIMVDCDTGGANVTVTAWIDGVALGGTFTANTAVRKNLIFSLPLDTTGIQARITATGSSAFVIYDYRFTYAEEPNIIGIQETIWTDEGWPYLKVWKHLVIEADTQNVARTLSFWLDNAVSTTVSVTANGRASMVKSLPADTIGRLARCTVSGDCQLYSVRYVVEKLPPDVTLADSLDQIFGWDGYKLIGRWIWMTMKNPSSVTLNVYADGTLKTTKTISSSNPASGWRKVKVTMPSNIKGTLFRFSFSSSSAFQIWWEQSEIEMKALNRDDGWIKQKFVPPQTF